MKEQKFTMNYHGEKIVGFITNDNKIHLRLSSSAIKELSDHDTHQIKYAADCKLKGYKYIDGGGLMLRKWTPTDYILEA